MRASSRLFTLVVVGLVTACSSDSTEPVPGMGGRIAGSDAILPKTGGAGVAGAAGAAGTAGKAGGGASGTSGTGGSTGGTAGTAGGGAAGASGAGAGGAGAAGASGAGAAGASGAGAGGTSTGGAGTGGGTGGAPPDAIVIESFNVALAGIGVEYLTDRRQPNYDAIAASPADVVCLQEAWQQVDKDGFVNAAKAKFPNTHFALTDNTTPYTDDRDLMGNTPAAPTAAPCAASAAKLQAAVSCASAMCSTTGDENGFITTLDCVKTKCVGAAIGLLNGSADDKRCYGCFAPQLASEKLTDIKNICSNTVRDGVAYQGQSSPMMLSRFPLKNKETYVLPAAWFRRVILKATVTHPTKGDIDVYCNHTNPIYAGGLLYPYTSTHGAGPSSNPWENEHALHVKRAIEWVNTTSGSKPAIIAGDFNASPEIKDGGGMIVSKADGAANLKMLTDAFVIAQSASYVPSCTFCSENPLIPASDKGPYTPEWLDFVFLKGIPVANVMSSERIYTAFSVTAKTTADPNKTIMLPLSDHYGFRTTITLP